MAWGLGLWKGTEFYRWVDDFKPDMILLQCGESYFMHRMAISLAKRTGAKLAIFNTEGFYFFDHDYFVADNRFGKLLFKLYRAISRYNFRRFMARCSKQIYLNEPLKADHDKALGSRNSIVIYTSSDITPVAKEMSQPPVFSYFGNMGFDRDRALIEFAEVLSGINQEYVLDVYGFVKSKEMEDRLRACPAIRFHGAVPYDTVKEVMSKSDFLVHVEGRSELWAKSLRYGFSTKIADSVSSGKIFILYSSPSIACAEYIIRTKSGIFASTPQELAENIKRAVNDADYAESIRANARIAAAPALAEARDGSGSTSEKHV